MGEPVSITSLQTQDSSKTSDTLGIRVCTRLRPQAEAALAGLTGVTLLPLAAECEAKKASGPAFKRSSDGQVSEESRPADGDGSGCGRVKTIAGRCVAASDADKRPDIVRVEWCERCAGDATARAALGLLIEKLALEWQIECQRQKLNAILANAYRRLTDYTMVQELVGSLTETLAEEKVVEKVFDIFTALLAPAGMTFVALQDDADGVAAQARTWSRPPGQEPAAAAVAALAGFRQAYGWTEDGRGFRLSARHRSKTLGVFEVRGIAPVEYKEHYLDLALIVTRVAGLAISNARLYRDMKGPNRTSLEFAENLDDALTARKRAEERQAQLLRQVEAANQELNDFAYVVSHDLKAPLRAIDSLARWLLADYGDKFDAGGREQMNLLVGRVDRMRALIDGILQYSRAGRLRTEDVPVDLGALVPEVIESIAPPAHIKVTVEGRFPVVTGDKVRFEQVFQNLLSNAVKYMDKPQGDVRIGCALEPEPTDDGRRFCRCHVADNGPGIAEKDFERVFRLFQTLRPRDDADSTGVGLSVVKKIVETGGGRVWLESVVGKGTTFYFTLPVATAESGGPEP